MASLLNYGEPEILELFKNTLPSKLYWILFPINNLREAIDTAKRVMNKEKLDKQLTGQASNISLFMKLGDDTHSGQQRMLKPQDLEAISSMMYNVSLEQSKTGKTFKPCVYQRRGRDQRQGYNKIDPEITVGKDKVLVKIGMVMTIEGMCTCKISVEVIAGTEVETSTETILVTGVDQEKEDYLPEGIIIIIDKTQTLDSDQGLGVDPTQE